MGSRVGASFDTSRGPLYNASFETWAYGIKRNFFLFKMVGKKIFALKSVSGAASGSINLNSFEKYLTDTVSTAIPTPDFFWNIVKTRYKLGLIESNGISPNQ